MLCVNSADDQEPGFIGRSCGYLKYVRVGPKSLSGDKVYAVLGFIGLTLVGVVLEVHLV